MVCCPSTVDLIGFFLPLMTLIAECIVECFDFAYSIVARSGSFAMVGPRLANNEEYLKAVKDHILGMIVTTRVQFMVPDCLKRYIGGFISRLATLGTQWDMNGSREILLKHFDARAAEYDDEMLGGQGISEHQTNPGHAEKPVGIAFCFWAFLQRKTTNIRVVYDGLTL